MKRILSVVLLTTICAGPALAQSAPTTNSGGGQSISVQSIKGTVTVRDTTSHTTLGNGTVVSTSVGKDGQPNGGAGGGGGGSAGGGGTAGGGAGASAEGD